MIMRAALLCLTFAQLFLSIVAADLSCEALGTKYTGNITVKVFPTAKTCVDIVNECNKESEDCKSTGERVLPSLMDPVIIAPKKEER